MHDGAIMIGVDDIILVAQHHGFIIPQPSSPRTLGVTVTQSQAFKFKFSDLEEGKFIPSPGAVFPSPLCYVPEGGAGTGWELTL
jgi:hypothetical protein